jgi:hypothetical protein
MIYIIAQNYAQQAVTRPYRLILYCAPVYHIDPVYLDGDVQGVSGIPSGNDVGPFCRIFSIVNCRPPFSLHLLQNRDNILNAMPLATHMNKPERWGIWYQFPQLCDSLSPLEGPHYVGDGVEKGRDLVMCGLKILKTQMSQIWCIESSHDGFISLSN